MKVKNKHQELEVEPVKVFWNTILTGEVGIKVKGTEASSLVSFTIFPPDFIMYSRIVFRGRNRIVVKTSGRGSNTFFLTGDGEKEMDRFVLETYEENAERILSKPIQVEYRRNPAYPDSWDLTDPEPFLYIFSKLGIAGYGSESIRLALIKMGLLHINDEGNYTGTLTKEDLYKLVERLKGGKR